MNYQPIGVFDSGYGGLTILKELVAALPRYDYLYLGDNGRAPYGDKDFDTVYHYTLECVKWFFEQGCHLVILACNTASAKALRTIQQNDLPQLAPGKRVLGVIRPTSEIIGDHTRTGHVGIMGTNGTVRSQSYLLEIDKFFPHVKVSQEACPSWVSLVENDLYHSPEADAPVEMHVKNLLAKDHKIDVILLACTHYPLLIEKIKKYVPRKVEIISQGKIVAESLHDYLSRHQDIEKHISRQGKRDFFTTGSTTDFDKHATIFFGQPVTTKHVEI